MKRLTPETPFKAIGSHEEDTSTPSPNPDATGTSPTPQIQDGDRQGTGDAAQTQTPETHRRRHLHQSLTMQNMQVNQVDPQQLESLLESLVHAKVSEHMMIAQEQIRQAQESARQAYEQKLAAENAMQRMREEAQEFQAQATASMQAAIQYAQEQVARDRMSAEAEIKRVREEADFRIAEIVSRSPPPVPATPTPAASSKGGFAQMQIPDWREEMARGLQSIANATPTPSGIPQPCAVYFRRSRNLEDLQLGYKLNITCLTGS